MTTSEVLSSLKKATGCSGIRLPRDMAISSQGGTLKIYASDPTENMQRDSSAFEAWIVAMKRWIPDMARRVEMDFEVPTDLPRARLGIPRTGHYNRFLYRMSNFSRIFPDWFSLGERAGEVAGFMAWLRSGSCLLNHSLKERKSVAGSERQERSIESWLAFEGGQEDLCKLWRLDPARLFNQLPVGLFREEIARDNAIFTRGGSAIDLWGIGGDGKTLHVIELKRGNNIGMGVISEMLFYTMVMYDARVAADPLFEFGRYKNSSQTPDMIAMQNGGRKFEHLHSHILAERYHPLFDDGVVELLNEGLSRMGIGFDRATYNFEDRRLPA
jgi:hypothetical protein